MAILDTSKPIIGAINSAVAFSHNAQQMARKQAEWENEWRRFLLKNYYINYNIQPNNQRTMTNEQHKKLALLTDAISTKHETQSLNIGELRKLVAEIALPNTTELVWVMRQSFLQGSKDCYVHPYSPAQRSGDKYSIYFYDDELKRNRAGTSVLSAIDSYAPRATIVRHPVTGQFYATDHVWLGQPKKCYGRFWKFNEQAWKWEIIKQDTEPSGEDRGLMFDTYSSKWILYQRRHPQSERQLEVKWSSNFTDWLTIGNVVFNHLVEPTVAVPYSAIPFGIGRDIYVCINWLSKRTWLVTPELYAVRNDSLPDLQFRKKLILPQTEDNKQVFAIPAVLNDKVVVTTIQCNDPHAKDDGTGQPTAPHYTSIYDMDVRDFTEWINN